MPRRSTKNKKFRDDLNRFYNEIQNNAVALKADVAKEAVNRLTILSPVWAGDYVESFQVGFGHTVSTKFRLAAWKIAPTGLFGWPSPISRSEAAAVKTSKRETLNGLISARFQSRPVASKQLRKRNPRLSENILIANSIPYVDTVESIGWRSTPPYHVFRNTIRAIERVLKTKSQEWKGSKRVL